MTVGGPLRGMKRALRISAYYMAAYFVCGAVVSIPFGPDIFTAHFFISTCLLFPCSFVLNSFLVRWFRRRTWRGEPRRFWLGAFLGVVITWGGIVLLVMHGLGTAIYFAAVHSIDSKTFALSAVVLLCNLSMLVAWALPGSGRGRSDR